MMSGKRLSVCLVITVCFAALVIGQSSSKKKDAALLAEKVSGLADLASRKSVIYLNGNKFREYVKNGPRNYSIVVMFTALKQQRQCMICQEAFNEFQIVANSYKLSSQSASNKLFLAMVDFDADGGNDIFQLMKLNTAPIFMHFPEKGKPKKMDTMDLQRKGFGADAISKFIAERTDISIKIFRPPSYTGTVVMLMVFTLVAGILYLRRDNLDFLKNKTAWSIIALFFVFAMISGQMWNHIRGPPFVQRTGKGVAYIHGSQQGQFVAETYFVAGLYMTIVFGMIMLMEAAEGKGGAAKRRMLAIIGLFLVAFFFSLILSIFRSKMGGGYPYSFLIK